MGRLTKHLTQTAYKVSTETNEYGDIVYTTASQGSPCMYRDIVLDAKQPNRDGTNLDGILWFDATEELTKGDVYLLEGEYLKIDRIVIARSRLRGNAIEFFKCGVTKQRQYS